jgi:hypothetical protein
LQRCRHQFHPEGPKIASCILCLVSLRVSVHQSTAAYKASLNPRRPKKTASYYALQAPGVTNACRCITASATACAAYQTKTRTVTETAVLTIKQTSTSTKTATVWKTKTEVRYSSTLIKPTTLYKTSTVSKTKTEVSTVVKPTTITTTSVSISIKPTTPTGCKVVSCTQSTVFSTATSTVSVRCSQTCSVRTCPPQAVFTTTKTASTVVSLSTVTIEKTIGVSIPAAQVSTLTLHADVSTVTQYSTVSSCPSSAGDGVSFPTYSVSNTTTAASSTVFATTSTLESTTSTSSTSDSTISTTTSTSSTPSSTACTSTGNLLTNGDFETGSLSPWNLTNGKMIITSPGYESDHALQYQSQDYDKYVTITQTVATTPGASYNFSMQITASSKDQDFYAWVWCKTPTHPDIDFSAYQSLSHSDVGKWILNTGELLAVAEFTTIQCLFNKDENAGNVLKVDDLYLGCA